MTLFPNDALETENWYEVSETLQAMKLGKAGTESAKKGAQKNRTNA